MNFIIKSLYFLIIFNFIKIKFESEIEGQQEREILDRQFWEKENKNTIPYNIKMNTFFHVITII